MTEKIVELLQHYTFSREAIVSIISMLPIVELRGAIPVGIGLFNFTPLKAFLLCTSFNILVVIPLLLFLNQIRAFLTRLPFMKKFMDRLDVRTMKKGGKLMRFGVIGLTLFVAVPLPVTGAWTGSLLSILFDVKFKWAFPAILLGVIIAGIAVTLITTGAVSLFG